MRGLFLAAVCAMLSGCLGLGQEKKVAAAEAPKPKVVRSDCYTVELFKKVKIEKPDKAVPEAYRAFLGNWGKGAWNGVWCHDLLINKVTPSGQVELYEMHAPYEPWGQPATAYKRTARIDPQGVLHLNYGTERITYRIVGGKLVGKRQGLLGNLLVTLARRGVPPVPLPRGTRPSVPGTAATVVAAATPAPAAPQSAAMQPTAAQPTAAQPTPAAPATQLAAAEPTATAPVPPRPAGRPTGGRALPGKPDARPAAAPAPAATELATADSAVSRQPADSVPIPVPRAAALRSTVPAPAVPAVAVPAVADELPPIPLPRPGGFSPARTQAQAMNALASAPGT